MEIDQVVRRGAASGECDQKSEDAATDVFSHTETFFTLTVGGAYATVVVAVSVAVLPPTSTIVTVVG